MQTIRQYIPIVVLLFLVVACGYRNPNVYSGPDKTIYITEWKNRTNQLGLNSEIYRSLTRWFQKSSSISTSRKKEGADIILAGEIVSLELPSLSYGVDNIATEVKLRLRVRYIIKEISTNKILLEVPDETWTEAYLISSTSKGTTDNEKEAIDVIIEDLSQKIYQRTLVELPKL
ncbi:MAG: LPS assembly lipoprotein LptE [Desulforhopalus sp.]